MNVSQVAVVLAILAIAVSVFVILKVRSNKKKLRAEQARRRAEVREYQRREEERRAKERQNRDRFSKSQPKPPMVIDPHRDVPSRANVTDKPLNVTRPTKPANIQAPRPYRGPTSMQGVTNRYDPSTDNLMSGMVVGGIAAQDWSRDDNSARDSGNSHSHGHGSTGSHGHGDSSGGSSSSDSGSSWSSDTGGGGDFSSGDSGSF